MKYLLDILNQIKFYTNASSVGVAQNEYFTTFPLIWYNDDLIFQLTYSNEEARALQDSLLDIILSRVQSELDKHKKGKLNPPQT